MKRIMICATVAAGLAWPSTAYPEILAMLNYESKPAEDLAAYEPSARGRVRQEGIAIIDVDPGSPNFRKIVETIPLPPDLVAHHIYYNPDSTKAYVTALGKSELRVIDMGKRPYTVKTIAVPECIALEDLVFSGKDKKWFLTCMGSSKVVIGDAATDQPAQMVDLPKPYPHGIAIHEGIDRILVPSTVRPSDLGEAGDTITAIEASTGKVLSSYKVSKKPSPAREAPVEVLFVPGADPPVAYVDNMYGNSLWAATWNPSSKEFEVAEAFDFASIKAGVPLEMYFNGKADRLYVTTAKPGHLHIFDISKNTAKPELVKSIPAAEGAHHVAITKDEKLAFVQNSFLNLPGMRDGSITIVDLVKGEAIGSIDTLKEQGFNPNCIVLLPQWNYLAGH